MPDSLITSISYISTARSDLETSDFQIILDSANHRNAELGLTGLLAFNGLNFMQILEGPRDNVNCCIRSIEADKRHDGMVIFDRREAQHREFPDWKMAGILLSAEGSDTKLGIDELLSSKWVKPETRKHFVSFKSFGSQAE
ncbi:MAG: BLUF domain-containing protein [Parasphingorhabdus sp.]|uniref:BLUF domain-containing protein n=1 Tax=Parasphingorhabdus sp. TaxID=2709688 RepID=UPI0030022500